MSTAAASAAPAQSAGQGSPAAVATLEPGVSFLTGLRPGNPAVLNRRPLAIKVDNEPEVVPQSGLNKADIVVEHPKERCMTRFTAIYQSQDAPRVGSIRSARIVDKELPVIFDAILGFLGQRRARPPDDLQVGHRRPGAGAGQRCRARSSAIPNIRVPFNLFTNTDTMWKVATQKGMNTPPKPTAAWVFSESRAGRRQGRVEARLSRTRSSTRC